jgi:hypothetical protein
MPHFAAYDSDVAEVCTTSIYPEAIKIYGNSFGVDKSARSELITAVWDFTLCHWAKAASVSKDRIALDTPGSVYSRQRRSCESIPEVEKILNVKSLLIY